MFSPHGDARASCRSSNMLFSVYHHFIWLHLISRTSINRPQIPWCCSKQWQHVHKMYSNFQALGRAFQFGFSRVPFSPKNILIILWNPLWDMRGEPVGQKNLTMNWVLPWWSTCLPAPRPVGKWLGRRCRHSGCSYFSVTEKSQYESLSKLKSRNTHDV